MRLPLPLVLLVACFAVACGPPNPGPEQPVPPAPGVVPPGGASTADGGTEWPTPSEEPTSDAGTADPAAPQALNKGEGESCATGEECVSRVCEGEGCGEVLGRCAAERRRCTRDLRPYCGCDGQTFQTSGSCPGRRYAHKGAC